MNTISAMIMWCTLTLTLAIQALGQAWSQHLPVVPPSCGAGRTSIAVGPNQQLHATYTWQPWISPGSCGSINAFYVNTAGLTATGPEGEADIAIDSTGALHVLYNSWTSTPRQIIYVSPTLGPTIVRIGAIQGFPKLAIVERQGANGVEAHFLYAWRDAANVQRLTYENSTGTYHDVLVGSLVRAYTIAVDPSGLPHVMFVVSTAGSFHDLLYTNASNWVPQNVISYPLIDGVCLRIDTGGVHHYLVSLTQPTSPFLGSLYYANGSAAGIVEQVTPMIAGGVSGLAMAIGQQGTINVLYTTENAIGEAIWYTHR